jgi:hypothetical protein
MKAEELTNPVVRGLVTAMRDSNRKAFFAAFSSSAKLTDDGNSQPLSEWVDREIFRAHGQLHVEWEDRDGLELTGRFESDQWDMLTVWRFKVMNDRIYQLDVAAM